jgi:hypothetical protein
VSGVNGYTIPTGLVGVCYSYKTIVDLNVGGVTATSTQGYGAASETVLTGIPTALMVVTQAMSGGEPVAQADAGQVISDGITVTGWPVGNAGAVATATYTSTLGQVPAKVVDNQFVCPALDDPVWGSAIVVQSTSGTDRINTTGVSGVNEYTIPTGLVGVCYSYATDVVLSVGGVTVTTSHGYGEQSETVLTGIPTALDVVTQVNSGDQPVELVTTGEVISDGITVTGWPVGAAGEMATASYTSTLGQVAADVVDDRFVCPDQDDPIWDSATTVQVTSGTDPFIPEELAG